MKRFTTVALAALTMAVPMSIGTANAQGMLTRRVIEEARDDRRDARDDRRDERRDVRDDRRDDRRDWRDDRRDDRHRWNRRQHNGYYLGNRWYYGHPSAREMQRRDFRAGYHQWRRGDRLGAYQREHYRRVDYRRERLRAPPRGYEYRRGDRDELLLVGIATGVILGVILAGH